MARPEPDHPPSLWDVAREWGRIGVLGFGGPPAHISLLRETLVERRRWIDAERFEHAIAACNLLPGPASTQLAIFCAWAVRGYPGALVGGPMFILPGLAMILALSVVFLGSPPDWVKGAGAGAGAAVAAVAVQAGWTLVGPSRKAAVSEWRWAAYLVLGAASGATIGAWLVLVLLACGACEVAFRRSGRGAEAVGLPALAALVPVAAATGGMSALVWVAIKVGALSYGGGFVIVPLMQHDAVDVYGWMSASEFLNAVALGQVTPGPVVNTIAVVGYAAGGIGGALLAAGVAFLPSFTFVLVGARHFEDLRRNQDVQGFLGGAGPAAIGAILGISVPLARALGEPWQWGVLAGAAVLLLVARRGVVLTLVTAGAVGAALALAGAPLP